jgi:hypothetical protein
VTRGRTRALPAAAVVPAMLALCALPAGPAHAAAMPEVAHVQAAYEAARAIVDPTQHANDLLIQTAICKPLAAAGPLGPQAACQIDFVRKLQPDGRLYFDVVTLEERPGGTWALLAGLCMTRPADKYKAAAAAARAAAAAATTTAANPNTAPAR